jgi:(1->4)-alpha-D-glucan 1-alpha-D-glucosylmutase
MSVRPLLATYRLQVHKEFSLEQAQAIVPYLQRLGVSHVYSSPQLRARSGSTHGYDVVDPLMLNPEIGVEADRRALVDSLHVAGLGMVLDIVPNHMGVGKENPYWQDVLMHGTSSIYADWFDIDWGTGRAMARTRVLLPVLGKELGEAIEGGEIAVAYEAGTFRVTYFDNWFPLDPATISDILNHDIGDVRSALGEDDPDLQEFDEIVDGLSSMPPRWSTEEGSRDERRRRSEATERRLEALLERSIMFREHVSRAVRTFATGSQGQRRLKTLLDMQAYELAFWQHASKRINYRRFFDISDLAGVKVENAAVFADTHRVILEWIADGSLDGVRVDHIDGLLDPLEYLDRLRRAAEDSSPVAASGFPIFVEKILSPGEKLREDWPVQGTTGYEFLNDLTAVFVSPAGSKALDEAFRARLRLTDRHMDFASVAYEGKVRVLGASLRPDVQRVARLLKPLLKGLAEPRALGSAAEGGVAAFIASLPVYRTYITGRDTQPHADDAAVIDRAMDEVRERDSAPDPVRERMRDLFLNGDSADPGARARFISRLQQISGPATAKGIEDTALYRYIPLASLNEVGSAPDRDLTTAVADFHRASALRARKWPLNLVCTNTHDTKRSADIRSRLHVLAEVPEEWGRLVRRWRRAHAALRTTIGRRAAPDAVTEYLLYQTLVGVWPFGGDHTARPEGIDEIRERVEAYMIKAAREAKSRTSWTEPDEEFETALKSFLSAILEDGREFLGELTTFVGKVARPGMWNALSRVVMHLTAPGTPDIYQGDELWNFSLVDPDNRRAVDYPERERQLSELESRFGSRAATAEVSELLRTAEDGRLKLYLTWRCLHTRRELPVVFGGSYTPLQAAGSTSEHVVAFLREGDGQKAVTIASRLPLTLMRSPEAPIADAWRDGSLVLPAGSWVCALSGLEVKSDGEAIPLATLLGALPTALFITRS